MSSGSNTGLLLKTHTALPFFSRRTENPKSLQNRKLALGINSKRRDMMASVKMIVAGLMMVASSHLSAQYTSLAERSVYTVKLVLDNASRLDKSDAVV